MVKRALLPVLLVLALSGCGYTTKTSLPEDVKSIYIKPVQNTIDLSAEISQTDRFRVYRPGIEVDVSNAITNRFVFDGTLKIASAERANAVLEARLTDYRRDPLRYTPGEEIQEYRLSIVVDVKVTRVSDGRVLMSDPHLTGDNTFYLSGPHAVSEDEAANKAVEDLARRVVERTIELW